MNYFFLFKALHIIGFVSWFAALFYLPRLFIYHVEALDMDEPKRKILLEQFQIMETRLYRIIMTPAMYLTLIGGFSMVFYGYGWEGWLSNIWLHWKLGFIILLIIYHYYCKKIMGLLADEKSPMTSMQFRLFNEITSILLAAIVLLAVFKNALGFIYAFVGLICFGIALAMGVKFYKKIREKSDEKN